MMQSLVYSLLADILRPGKGLTLHLFNSVLVIDLLFTSMKPRCVNSLLADVFRAGESLALDLFNL